MVVTYLREQNAVTSRRLRYITVDGFIKDFYDVESKNCYLYYLMLHDIELTIPSGTSKYYGLVKPLDGVHINYRLC
jgi:hypothetical protein